MYVKHCIITFRIFLCTNYANIAQYSRYGVNCAALIYFPIESNGSDSKGHLLMIIWIHNVLRKAHVALWLIRIIPCDKFRHYLFICLFSLLIHKTTAYAANYCGPVLTARINGVPEENLRLSAEH